MRPQARAAGRGVRDRPVARHRPPTRSSRGDADRVLQALSNLVENALRVLLPVARFGSSRAPGLLAVEDDGPGVDPDDVPRAFERFFLHSRYAGADRSARASAWRSSTSSPVRWAARVDVRSRPGKTRFSIRLPAELAGARAARELERTAFRR